MYIPAPSYHGSQCYTSNDQGFWVDCLDRNDVDSIISFVKDRGYISSTDIPTCFMVKELADAFPDASVILGIRDSPKKWVESFENTVMQHYREGF
ncbi:Oidioi.mRNA.OKI2018_I69.chr2.g4498.t1.cds [Oikopleura dioica]|uniref:Oidioi.mRNA.OKI2018_I69.chr2.g4498.t1.cds n=1 Tax=Oikopleura dioica TaxID=34765 RepID=A0ABN7T3Y9_OIKDI|nr:Oidioi.mRNA.OKI2018_I69.chr2.g4498.t1.cds [Oikopleura dioica]